MVTFQASIILQRNANVATVIVGKMNEKQFPEVLHGSTDATRYSKSVLIQSVCQDSGCIHSYIKMKQESERVKREGNSSFS